MHNSAEKPTAITSALATPIDFCRALQANTKSLYLLAFLLTANHEAAEQCFFETVEAVMSERRVFRKWVNSWIKRTLVKAAISKVLAEEGGISSTQRARPLSKEQTGELSCRTSKAELEATIISVTCLCPLDRLVFVTSVLEDYSMRECSLLLNCSLTTVLDARIHALQMLPVLQASQGSARNSSIPSLEVTTERYKHAASAGENGP